MLTSLTVTVVAEDSVGYETPFLGQHGVSFHLEATHRAENGELLRRSVLVDVAQHPQPLLHNMKLLTIDPEEIDTVVLTHCHYDHTQGLVEILRATGKENIPVIAHPDLFRLNFADSPQLRHIGVMNSDRAPLITEAGGMLFPVREPMSILPGLITSGEIPRQTDYENKETSLKTIRDGKIVVDEMIDELSVYCHVAGVGTVVVTGCSHAGVVNITRHAKKLTGAPVAAVIGGLHLIESTEERIQRTTTDLYNEEVQQVIAGHCTGFPAQAALYGTFGARFVPMTTGQVFHFSAE